jgi:ubiquitin-protein ligase
MQSYQTIINTRDDTADKISYIVDIIRKNSSVKSWKLSLNLLELVFDYNKKTYVIKIHSDKNKAIYIFAELDNSNDFENQISNKLNIINLEIDNYERVEDVMYDVIYIFDEFVTNYTLKTRSEIKSEKKCIIDFTAEIELLKKSIKRNLLVSKVLSLESTIEMLGDQLIKLQMSKNYSVDIKDLQNFTIEISNLNLVSSQNIPTSNLKIYVTVKLPNDFISNPPSIELKSNYVFKNNILNVIEKLKPFTDDTKWSIKYSVFETVENIYQMISKYGELDTMAKSELDGFLMELEYLLSIKSDNISENKLLLEFDEFLANELAGFVSDSLDKKPSYWKTGTGYGHSSSSTWNIDEYANAVKQRKIKIVDKLNILFVKLDKTTKLETEEIEKLKSIFKYYMLDDELDSGLVTNIASVISNHHRQFDDKIFISSVVKNVKDYLEDANIKHPITQIVENVITLVNNLDEFQQIFNEYKFKYYDGEFNSFHYPQVINLTSNQVSRLQKEFQILKKSISLNKEASIFFCIQKHNVNKIKFMISGPKNTPYEYGLLIFDMTMGNTFPSAPPHVNLSNTGSKRFNPNLYNCGKVCLSLLGTWSGDKGESWNINTSSFNQLLISIQSQILVDEPYFNEPGHERSIGTESGIKHSTQYNHSIRQYTLDHAMCDLIDSNKYPEFQDIINKYFKYQKSNIIKTLNKWLEEMEEMEKTKDVPKKNTEKFKKSYNRFVELVNKLA